MKTDAEKLTEIIQHIKRVENNCNILARKYQSTDFDFALKLIRLGRIHDASKFEKFEFDHLHSESTLFLDALKLHHKNNPHHPEHWSGGIHEMPKIYLAEMVCDCKARGEEFGTSTRLWFHEHATQKYKFSMTDDCGIHIENFMNLLMPEPFDTKVRIQFNAKLDGK
jgi:hypothetical protein